MDYFIAIAPSLGVGLLFYIVIRAFVTADRRERASEAQLRKEIAERLREEADGEKSSPQE